MLITVELICSIVQLVGCRCKAALIFIRCAPVQDFKHQMLMEVGIEVREEKFLPMLS